MNVFKIASERQANGYGYNATKTKFIWQSKKCSWNNIRINWGIRRSEMMQIFPIWNSSHNCQRALMFGFGLIYFEIVYYRKGYFNQNRKLFMKRKLWHFYQLVS